MPPSEATGSWTCSRFPSRSCTEGRARATVQKLPLIIGSSGELCGCIGGARAVRAAGIAYRSMSPESRSTTADVHPVTNARSAARSRRCSACSRSTGCRCRTIPCSTCRDLLSRAGTGFFSASKRAILNSISIRRADFWKASELGRSRPLRRSEPRRSPQKPQSTQRIFWGILLLAVSACRQDMHDQPKYSALEASSFFANNSSARAPVAGTVARGELKDDTLLYTGKVNGEPASGFPFPVDAAVVAHGQERFNIYCSPCHGQTGAGDGMIVQRGFSKPPRLDEPRLRDAPVDGFRRDHQRLQRARLRRRSAGRSPGDHAYARAAVERHRDA